MGPESAQIEQSLALFMLIRLVYFGKFRLNVVPNSDGMLQSWRLEDKIKCNIRITPRLRVESSFDLRIWTCMRSLAWSYSEATS